MSEETPLTAGKPVADDDERGWPYATLVVGAGVLLFGGFALQQSLAVTGKAWEPAGPKFLPVVVSTLWIFLAVCYLIEQFKRVRTHQHPAEADRFDNLIPVAGVLVVLIVYAYVLDPLGYIVSTAIMFVVIARILGSRNVMRDIVIGIGLTILVFMLFSRFLGISLPAGVIPL